MGPLLLSSGVALVALMLGAFVFARSPRHPAHFSFGFGMAVLAAETLLTAMGARASGLDEQLAWHRWSLAALSLVPAPWLMFSRAYSRGDATAALARWRLPLIALAVVPLAFACLFRKALVEPVFNLDFGETKLRLGLPGVLVEVVVLLASVGILTNFERTFRGSIGVMRWRLKYVVLGVGVLFGFRLFASSQALLYRTVDEPMGRAGAAALLVGCVLIAVAIARGRHFDVEVYPSQSLVYGSLTVLLAGAYLIIVGVLSQAVTLVGGNATFPLRAFFILIALAGLAVGLLSERFRQGLRRFVSRHLRRPVYDYRRVWSTFTTRTTSLVDEADFCRAVANWVSETFQTLSASVWLVEPSGDRLRLGGSTVLGDTAAGRLEQPGDELRDALAAIDRLTEPTVLDRARQPWAATLRQLHPGVFAVGGDPVFQPLHGGGKLLGILILGDRVGGIPFTTEDFDLLKCIGDQVAAGLLGLQLSLQLLRAKEMEAFQTMSAFFVHDLKNTASTLSLTLQNLQDHFSDPAFRDDALRAVGKSVQHINGLIARLSRLRQELRIQPMAKDLAPIVEAALASLGPAFNVRIRREFEGVPPVLVDGEQLQKVVVNLVLNAGEAMGPGGEVHITATRQNGWAALSVIDHGAGMSPEFIRESLFRPFQTTKKNGLGIGMFHSKMIVEAHNGRMEVQSAVGKGTTIRILLPLAANA